MSFFARLGRLWLLIVFAIICVYAALTNGDRVGVRLPPLMETINLPVYLVIAGAFAVGAATSAAFFGGEHIRRGFKIRRLEKELNGMPHRQPVIQTPPVPPQEPRL